MWGFFTVHIFILKGTIVIKLKTILNEGFAWERKADGSLPTIADTTAAYEAKMREQAELNMPFTDSDEDVEEVEVDTEETDEVEESAKPDYIDLDGDGDKEETMKQAAKDKEAKNESSLITKAGLQEMREISLEDRILRNLKGNDYILRETFKK